MRAGAMFVSVVMPVRNEAPFIAGTIGQLLAQEYPADRFEILVADGMSDDGTRDIVSRLAAADSRIRLLDNPGMRSSSGRNVGFRAGRGDVFVVVDGHCHIPDRHFLGNVASCFEQSGADCLGRPQPLDPPGLTPFQVAVALARASRLGHGGDSLIYGDFEGFASPVSNGAAYRREVFDRIGYVDETFDACEDVEFNYRLEQAGLKAFTSPKLTLRYYPRETPGSLFSQMRRYGSGRTRFYFLHPEALSLSALVPACFAAGCAAFAPLLALHWTTGLAPAFSVLYRFLGLCLLAYVLLVGAATARICRDNGWIHAARLPLIFAAVHGGLGLGMWEELACMARKSLARRRRGRGRTQVALVIDTIESPTAGTERQLLLLLEGLDRAAFEPRLCVLQSSAWLENDFPLCPVHVIGIRSYKDPRSWLRVLRFALWLWRERVDVLQAHFRDASLAGLVAAWLARVPGIVATRKNQGYWLTSAELRLQKILNFIPDVFVANSEDTRRRAQAVEGIPPGRMRVIHNGLRLPERRPDWERSREMARDLLGLHHDIPVAGIVANLRPVKRLDVFLHAASLVRGDIPEARFVVVGEGGERAALESLARQLGLEESVMFLGRRNDVEALLPGFDAGVLSSDSESFSNSVVEYMAAGLPVAATDVGGCREALGDSPAGKLVPPGDARGLGRALSELLRAADLREHARREHPRRAAEMFSSDRYLEAYASLYRELTAMSEGRA